MREQPAKKNYFFGQAYQDLRNTIQDSYKANVDKAQKYFKKASDVSLPTFYWGLGVATYIFGMLVFLFCSMFHILFVSVISLVFYINYSIVYLVDWSYRKIKGIFSACPHCYTKSILPVYHCPKCNAEHTELWPGPYGVYSRTCKCGNELPTTFFNGRNRLYATCPNCNRPIEAKETRPIAVPIIGAPSVGKTFFLFSMLWYIKEVYSPGRHASFEFMNNNNVANYNTEIGTLNRGMSLRKTVENNPVAMNFFLTQNGKKALYYFYDSAGEAFSSTENLVQHKFYDYFNGLIFIIDPFSIPMVYERYANQLRKDSSVKPSSAHIEDVFDALIINLERNYHVKANQRIYKPVAVAISKVDAFDLEYIIGESVVESLYQRDENIKSISLARRKIIEEFFRMNDMENLFKRIVWKFPNVEFFTIASQGENSKNINLLTNWLIEKIHK